MNHGVCINGAKEENPDKYKNYVLSFWYGASLKKVKII